MLEYFKFSIYNFINVIFIIFFMLTQNSTPLFFYISLLKLNRIIPPSYIVVAYFRCRSSSQLPTLLRLKTPLPGHFISILHRIIPSHIFSLLIFIAYLFICQLYSQPQFHSLVILYQSYIELFSRTYFRCLFSLLIFIAYLLLIYQLYSQPRSHSLVILCHSYIELFSRTYFRCIFSLHIFLSSAYFILTQNPTPWSFHISPT